MNTNEANNRRHRALSLSLLLALSLSLCACHPARPERPVTSMYPTVIPADNLDSLVARTLSQNDLQAILDEAGLTGDLSAAGFLDTDRAIILRGLGKHGYAEIDGRRCKGLPWLWVSFFIDKDDDDKCALYVTCGYEKLPRELKHLLAIQPFPTLRQAANGQWQGIFIYMPSPEDHDPVLLVKVYRPGENLDIETAISHWEYTRAFPLDAEP